MDVRLPDGTVIQNVPDGITKAALTEKLAKNGYDVSKLGAESQSKPLPANAGLANFVASTLGLPVDTVANAINLGIAGVGTAATAMGRPDLAPNTIDNPVGGAQSIRNALNATGIPGLSPNNPTPNSPAGTAAYEMASRGGFIPGGALPAAASIVAEKALGPQYAGVGAMIPGAVGQAASALKPVIANPETIQKNIQTFKQAGTTPDVAQATESNFFRGLTNVVARIPGGQGVISKFRELEQKALGNAAETGVSAESGGRAIQKGITGDGGFLDRTKQTWLKLDQDVADKVGTQYGVPPVKTQEALDALTKPIAGAENTSGLLVNQKIAQIKDAFMQDVKGNMGAVPFDALRQLRSKVGSMLDDSLVSGIPGGELKKLYGAISQDLESAANAVGAGKEFTRQSNYYKARMDRIETTLDKVLGKGTPEDVFKAVAPTDVDSVNKIRRVMRSIGPEERQVVSDAVVNRLGRAVPGKATLDNDFSSETFLTNWNKINDSAKSQLFPDVEMRSKLDAIAKVASDVREGKAVFGNPSGTSQGVTAGAIYGSIPAAAGMAVTGNLPAAAATLTTAGSLVAGANIGARMLTSPKVVDWLARTAKVSSPEQQAAQLGRLAIIFNQTKDAQLKQELGNYASSIGTPTPQQ